MKSCNLSIILCCFILFFSCSKESQQGIGTDSFTVENSFDLDTESWIAGFADYCVGEEAFFELASGHKFLPDPLNQADGAFFISGDNHSDDLFMFLKKEIAGLKPNSSYSAKFTIDFASDAPSNWVGIGGPPGEAVVLGIGITVIEPIKVVNKNYYEMNIDKGNQIKGGPARKVIGNVANGTDLNQYVLLQKSGEFDFRTDNTGKVWATVSTESGFEGTTALFYSKIKIEFTEKF